MIKHYLKTAWRTLLRSKGFSVINITGLAIGMASAVLILIWLQNMMTTDRFYKQQDQLYILCNRDSQQGNVYAWQYTPKILGPTLRQEYPEVEDIGRYGTGSTLFTAGEKKITAEGAFADTGFLKMFDLTVINGRDPHPLQGSDKVILTESFARALFGDADPVGKTLQLDNRNAVTVSAVIKDLPANTQFDYKYLLSWDYAKKIDNYDEYWSNNSVATFVLLKPGTDIRNFNSKIRNITIAHNKRADMQTTEVFALPLSKRFLYDKAVNGRYVTGTIVTVRLFGIIALLILLIACINFMNLSTARSEKRAREVGVRKVIGAPRRALISQFLMESVLMSAIAFVLAIGIVVISLPFFNRLVGKQLSIAWQNPFTWLFALGFVLFTGLLAGSYPALFLSRFQPVKVLKGRLVRMGGNSRVRLRSVLVVIQFTFSLILIISTIVVSRQINYTEQRDSGYTQNGLVYSFLTGDMEKNYTVIKNELLASGAVTAVSKNMSPVTHQYSNGWGANWPGATTEEQHITFSRYSTDAGFVATMQASLLAGRDIDITKYPSDSSACLINETALKLMKLKNPIGQRIEFDTTFHIVGVIRDFVIEGVESKVEPMIIQGPCSWFTTMHYRLNPSHPTADNLKKVQAIMQRYNPAFPFEYTFVDKDYAKKFAALQQTSRLSSLFAGLTIFISCLGLLGLIMFMAEARIKEIGIRKVLGASILSISTLLSRQLIQLVVLSFVIAAPIAWYLMHRWLLSYDYRVGIRWWWFALAGITGLMIAVATVSWQAVKAARANPVKSLKTE
ncbi:duplicated orphan permease [Arachidicoccus rhizosphaerae]|uniref:Duplicated orphan permease n=1 Tax=Arachidicoccus rhizosphaerae TaxID=551991 RepID=A0A1H4CUM0_9BACT|nr:ABC transporter permease [Arachidicoccus rhizosphaerae]SEA64071.1 duplicated orphan permease [Arachidicoccus rhizosphaerae]